MIKKITLFQLIIGFIFISGTLRAQKISPFLYGQNLWLTNGSEGRPGYIDEIWGKVEESGVKIIRIGGAGYDRNMPPLDTLEHWVKSIKAIGAEPLMQVSKIETPEESAKLVAYFNKNKKTYVKYWSIGNEPYHMDKYPIDSIAVYIKKHATAMKAVDPSIKITVPDLAAYYNNVYEVLLLDNKKGVAGRDENGNWYIDGINFHNYPNSNDYSRSDVIFFSVSKMRGMVLDAVRDIEKANAKYDRTGADRLNWSITEFNITYNNPEDLSVKGIAVPSFINGQFWVDIFALGMEHEAFTVTPWCIQESDRARTYFGYVGAPPNFIPHATYYHLQMMSRHMNGEYIKMKSASPYLKVFATTEAGNTTVMLVNQDSINSYKVDFSTINTENLKKGVIGITAAKELSLGYKGVSLPNSTRLLKFNAKGEVILHLLYDLDMAINDLPPSKQK